MQLTLCYFPNSCSTVPWLLLTEVGATFDVRTINLMKGEQLTSEFGRINPKRAVPVLIIDGEPLTENVAIQLWIARQFPAARLVPTESSAELRMLAFLSWCASGLHPFLTPNALPQRYCDLPGSEESVRRCAHRMLQARYAIAEEQLADGREWFFGDFSAADAYFFWAFRRGLQFKVDVMALPYCRAHQERMQRRASVQALQVFEQATMARLAGAA